MPGNQRSEAYLASPAAELGSATAELAAALELAGGTVVVMVDDWGALGH
jgi:hypothetical protein